MVAKLEQRTQFLDRPTSLIVAPTGVSIRRNTWMAGGTAVPLIQEPVYQNIDFIGNLLFGRFFSSESPPPIPEMGRAFTLPDDVSGAVAIRTAKSPTPQPPSNEFELVTGASQSNTHTYSSPNQTIALARLPKQSAGTDLRDETNGLLRSLNLEELSPNEERQLHTPSAPQLVLEPPPTTEGPAGGDQPTTFVEEPSPAGKAESPPDEKSRKSRRFPMPKFPSFGIDPSAALGLAASVIQMVDIAAKLATEYRSLSYGNRELLRLASTLSGTSDVLQMIFEITRTNMLGPVQDFALKISKESEREVMAAQHLLQRFDVKPDSRSLDGLIKTIKLRVNRKEVENVTQALERLDEKFGLVLQIHQVNMTQSMWTDIRLLRGHMPM